MCMVVNTGLINKCKTVFIQMYVIICYFGLHINLPQKLLFRPTIKIILKGQTIQL